MMENDTAATLYLAAAIVTRADGWFLTVRKRDTHFLLQPGGKIERGESAEAAVRREVREELGVEAEAATFVSTLRAPAANETGVTVHADVFAVAIGDRVPRASAEIAELVWLDPHASLESPPLPYPLAELSRKILLSLAPR